MEEILVKIMVELLGVLALATLQIKQGRLSDERCESTVATASVQISNSKYHRISPHDDSQLFMGRYDSLRRRSKEVSGLVEFLELPLGKGGCMRDR